MNKSCTAQQLSSDKTFASGLQSIEESEGRFPSANVRHSDHTLGQAADQVQSLLPLDPTRGLLGIHGEELQDHVHHEAEVDNWAEQRQPAW